MAAAPAADRSITRDRRRIEVVKLALSRAVRKPRTMPQSITFHGDTLMRGDGRM